MNIISLVALTGACVLIQPGRSPLDSVISTTEYFGEAYLKRGSDGLFVFLAGEPVKVKVAIGNATSEDERFHFSNNAAEAMFILEATRDGSPIPITVRFDEGTITGYQRLRFDIDTATTLRPRERVEWIGAVDGPLLPGTYAISLTTSAVDGQGRPILPIVGTYRFEVRAAAPAFRPEILRREAQRHLGGPDADLDEASAAVDELLRLHPQSHTAFVLRGRIALERRDVPGALANFARAAAILRSDADTLFAATKSKPEREQMLRHVEAMAREAKR